MQRELERRYSARRVPMTTDKCRQVSDVTAQILELKLQISPTVDLGLINPGSPESLEQYSGLKMADIRYAIFYCTIIEDKIRLDYPTLTTGANFF